MIIRVVFNLRSCGESVALIVKGTGVCSLNPNQDAAYAATLFRRATTLQLEAQSLIQTLGLPTMLEAIGPVELVGSVASGLMVWRDIDFCVECPGLTPERAWTALHPFLLDPRLTRLDYHNETGEWLPEGDPADQRLYFVLRYTTGSGAEWKIDISLWTVASPSAPGELLAELDQTLTSEMRLAILWIKDIWHQLPVYPYAVSGFEVYDAVLHYGVRTPEAFDHYLHQCGLPGRD